MKTAVLLTVALLGAVHLATAAPLLLLAANEDPQAEAAEKRALAAEIAQLQRELFKTAPATTAPAPVVVQVPSVDVERQLAIAEAWERLILKWLAVAGVVLGAASVFLVNLFGKVKELKAIAAETKERQARQSTRMEGLQSQVNTIALATPGTGTGSGTAGPTGTLAALMISGLLLQGCAGYDTTLSVNAGEGKRTVGASVKVSGRDLPRTAGLAK